MPSHITDVEGDWKIVDYAKHPECLNYKIEIKGCGLDPNIFKLYLHVINYLNCVLQHNAKTQRWEVSNLFSTEINSTPETLGKERVFKRLISELEKLELQDEKRLVIETKDGEKVRLQRLP